MKKHKQFEGIDTGLVDVNGKSIINGCLVKRGTPLPLSSLPNKNIAKMKKVPYRVVYHDGAFKLKNTNSTIRVPLNSLVIRYYGIEVIGG